MHYNDRSARKCRWMASIRFPIGLLIDDSILIRYLHTMLVLERFMV